MKLLEKVRQEIRRRNYSYSTEKSYTDWIKQFIRFNNMQHPNQLAEKDIVNFLNHLVKTLLNYMEGIPFLVSSLLYGTGLRISEGLRVRV